jgi:antitoxin YefM
MLKKIGPRARFFSPGSCNRRILVFSIAVSEHEFLWYDISYAKRNIAMTILKASEARSNLYRLIDEAAEHHAPVQITGKRNNAVLVGEDDWRSIQETLYLLSIPGMRESIRKGMAEPVAKLAKKPGW